MRELHFSQFPLLHSQSKRSGCSISAVMGERNTANEILATIFTSLSLFGTLFIIVSFFLWKDIRTTSRRILVYISIADFLTCVATIAATTNIWLSGTENKHVCFVQSIIGTFSVLTSFFWTVSMALYLYISVCWKNSRLAERSLYLFHVCGWGIPAVIVCVAASTHKLGDNGNKVSAGWCWISIKLSWLEQVEWMLLAGKLWEIMAFCAIVVLYALVKRNMKKELHEKNRVLTESTVVQAQKAERKLICVPLLFVFLRVWGTIRFLLMIVYAKNPDYESPVWLLILQGIGDNAPGFANFLLFCFFTEKCLGKFRRCFQSCTMCFDSRSPIGLNCSNSLQASYSCDVTIGQPIINQHSMNKETDCLKGHHNTSVDYSSINC